MKPFRLTQIALLIPAIVATLLIWQRQAPSPDWQLQWPTYVSTPAGDRAEFASQFASSATDHFVHAASVTALPDGRLLSVWFGGSREGASDVKIYGAYYDPATRSWGDDHVFASSRSTQDALGRTIRKLGNPVITQAPDGKLWLFYVSVSVGGWAGSAINATYSLDAGETWTTPARLITTPFFNISTLVKGTPFYYTDGSIGLPVYHEFMGKFAELLRLDTDGKVLDKTRISHGKHSLQPVIVPSSHHQAVALLRYAGAAPKRLLASHSADGGKHWDHPVKTRVANSNAAISAVRMADGAILGVMNDLDDGRHRLSLLRSDDEGETWQRLRRLEDADPHGNARIPRETYTPLLEAKLLSSAGAKAAPLWQSYRQKLDKRVCKSSGCRFVFDYPYMIQGPSGDYHIVYTWNKSFIKHLRFNQAWVDSL